MRSWSITRLASGSFTHASLASEGTGAGEESEETLLSKQWVAFGEHGSQVCCHDDSPSASTAMGDGPTSKALSGGEYDLQRGRNGKMVRVWSAAHHGRLSRVHQKDFHAPG